MLMIENLLLVISFSLSSKKIQALDLFITEVEYQAIAEVSKEALQIKSSLSKLGLFLNSSIKINVDNQDAISITTNPIIHSRTRHIELHQHFMRNLVNDNTINLFYCPTYLYIVNILINPLIEVKFMKL